jgi:hypothetical protein
MALFITFCSTKPFVNPSNPAGASGIVPALLTMANATSATVAVLNTAKNVRFL